MNKTRYLALKNSENSNCPGFQCHRLSTPQKKKKRKAILFLSNPINQVKASKICNRNLIISQMIHSLSYNC